MKKRILLCSVCAALVASSMFFGGCELFKSDTINVTVSNEYYTPSDEQWQKYIDSLTPQSGERLQAAVNHSLMSGVSILTQFSYTERATYGYSSRAIMQQYDLVYTGSGVIVELDKQKGDAYVITNCHVVYSDTSDNVIADKVNLYLYGQDASEVNYTVTGRYCTYRGYDVYGSNGKQLIDYDIVEDDNYRIDATVVAASVAYDIALLKVTGSEVLKNSDARVAEFAESDNVYAGQQVYAIGNPEGEGASATVGIISKTGEEVDLSLSDNEYAETRKYRVIRTDAAINGGNSGGGLYNAEGKLVGIVNSKTVSEEVDNMGYALPASNVKRLWLLMKDNQVLAGISNYQTGVRHAKLPVSYEITATSSYLSPNGAEVVETISVVGNGGEFLSGDVIKHIKVENASGEVALYGETDVNRIGNIVDVILTARVGYTVTVTVQRGAETKDISFICSDSDFYTEA